MGDGKAGSLGDWALVSADDGGDRPQRLRRFFGEWPDFAASLLGLVGFLWGWVFDHSDGDAIAGLDGHGTGALGSNSCDRGNAKLAI